MLSYGGDDRTTEDDDEEEEEEEEEEGDAIPAATPAAASLSTNVCVAETAPPMDAGSATICKRGRCKSWAAVASLKSTPPPFPTTPTPRTMDCARLPRPVPILSCSAAITAPAAPAAPASPASPPTAISFCIVLT